jgi:hypothetical protein
LFDLAKQSLVADVEFSNPGATIPKDLPSSILYSKVRANAAKNNGNDPHSSYTVRHLATANENRFTA